MKHKATIQMQLWIVIGLVFFLLLQGCASNDMTPDQRAAHEADRQEKYVIWHDACLHAKLQIAAIFHPGERSPRCLRKVEVCVPSRLQWDFYYKSEEVIRKQHPSKPTWRVKSGNTYQCGRWTF